MARSILFSAILPPGLVASVSTALDIIEEKPELRARLWSNTNKMLRGYKPLGYDTGISETSMIPILIKNPMTPYRMCKYLFENGIFVDS
jgi:8-amino-7-oxononanoate synthase